jgi:hypothetical protein
MSSVPPENARPTWLIRLLQMGMVGIAVALVVWRVWFNHSVAPSGSLIASAGGDAITRAEVLAIARQYAEHRWTATAANILHGPDAHGVQVDTPDATNSSSGQWSVDAENVGVPYKWGGFDSLVSFDAGLRARLAAGDIYSTSKRRAGGGAVSDDAVGIDCSGFISRCWKLRQKLGTANLPGVCVPLTSTDELQPGDILNQPRGHVLLFVSWTDSSKSRARFYEAEPRSKVVASEHDLWSLRARGAKPWRYLRIQD